MTLRRTFLPIVFLAATGGPFIFSYSTTESASQQPDPNQCRVTVSGDDKADMLPAHDVWEAAFKRHSDNPSAAAALGLGNDTRARVAALGAVALQRATALRQSLPTKPTAGFPREATLDRDLVIADSILDARDNVLRELSDDDFTRWSDYAQDTARTLRVILPVPGRVIQEDTGERFCEVVVKGREYPHLLPEHQVWRFMFEAWSRAVDYNLEQHGRITDEYLRLLSRSVFRMPPEDVRVFLQIAKDTAVEVAGLTSTPATDVAEQRQFEMRLQRAIMSARYHLLRRISVEGWRAMLRYVDDYRVGVKSWFRSAIVGL
ncbi:MAG TPA: hypothetical protein VIL28_11980 [Steroidobacteraceae bacterium]|jgi:hypothetical protein